jgi:hypothetical protein
MKETKKYEFILFYLLKYVVISVSKFLSYSIIQLKTIIANTFNYIL